MKLKLSVFGVLLLAILVIVAPAQAKRPHGQGPAPQIDPATFLVKFAPAAKSAAARVDALGDAAVGKTGDVTVVRIQKGEDVHAKIRQYKGRGDVLYAEPNYRRKAAVGAPNDSLSSLQWGLSAIHAVGAWSIYPGVYGASAGVPIAVVDTGVDSSHPDLVTKVNTASGATCTSGLGSCASSAGRDDEGHGTHVAGIAAAETGNGLGVAGVAFNSPIIPVKVLDSSGGGWDNDIATGIAWAVSHGARVINLSLGGPGGSTTLCNAVSNAVANGVIVVAAAGNEGSDVPSYPAACAAAIGVAATASDNTSPDFSNFGAPNVFLSAPGVDVESTFWPTPAYTSLTGTSMASPFVAGVAALLVSQKPSRGTTAVKTLLATTAQKVGADFYPGLSYGGDPYGTCMACTWHAFYGYGLVDAAAALDFEPIPRVTSLSASHAIVGQQVTLTGANFTGATSVTFSGVSATFTVDSATQITATVPNAGFAVGRWRVTTGVGTGLYDPLFTIDPPLVSSTSASHALVGQQVTLTGTGFVGVTAVTLGGVNASYTVNSATQITATVPSTTFSQARWRVVNAYGTGLFDPLFTVDPAPIPAIASQSASHAGIGQQVVLTGTNFTGSTAVTLAGAAASFSVDSPTQITATVPDVTFAQGRWRVTNSYGTGLFDALFTVDLPVPAIGSLSVSHALVGASVVLTGTSFTGATAVTFGGVNAAFTVDSPTQITATVPSTVFSQARWRVVNAYGTGVFDPVFTVDPPPAPAIGSLSSTHATVGQQVILTGSNFGAASAVTLAGMSATYTVDSPTQITATVPDTRVTLARWRVTNSYGTGLFDPVFTTDPALISTLSANHALVGTQVTLTGAGFVGVTAVTFGGVNAPYTVDSPTQITATVPSTTGFNQARWRVVNPYGTGVFDAIFTADPAPIPAIATLSRTHATVGEQVILTGTNFTGATAVTLAGVNATFTVDSPTQITVVVPDDGVTRARWRVTNSYGTGLFDTIFTTDPAVITALSVSHARAGQSVIVTGVGFVGVTAVTFGGVNAVFVADSPTQITATVPTTTGFTQARWRVVNFYGTGLFDPVFTVDP